VLCASNELCGRPTPTVVYTPDLGFVTPVVSACDVGVVPEDWVRPGVSIVVQRVLQQVQTVHNCICRAMALAADKTLPQ